MAKPPKRVKVILGPDKKTKAQKKYWKKIDKMRRDNLVKLMHEENAKSRVKKKDR